MTAPFPLPLCATCARGASCERLGRTLPDYPRCWRPLVGARLDRLRDLVAFWEARDAVHHAPWRLLLDAVLARFAEDRWHHWACFEPSYSWDENGAHFYRYSYAFPAFRTEDADAARTLRAFAVSLGAAATSSVETVIRAARDPVVDQPLLGVADDGAAGRRIKLYLQFRQDTTEGAARLAAALTGCSLDLARPGALHLLGLDVGEQGLRGAKLYYLRPSVAPRELETLFGRERPLFRDGPMRNLLFIHRLAGPNDRSVLAPSEIDFALAENELTFAQLAAAPALAHYQEALTGFAALQSAFRVGVRRVSVALPPGRKLSFYYLLAEVESLTNPSGGS